MQPQQCRRTASLTFRKENGGASGAAAGAGALRRPAAVRECAKSGRRFPQFGQADAEAGAHLASSISNNGSPASNVVPAFTMTSFTIPGRRASKATGERTWAISATCRFPDARFKNEAPSEAGL